MDTHSFSDPRLVVVDVASDGGDGQKKKTTAKTNQNNTSVLNWEIDIIRKGVEEPVWTLTINNTNFPPRRRGKKVVWKLPTTENQVPKFGDAEKKRLWELYKTEKKQRRKSTTTTTAESVATTAASTATAITENGGGGGGGNSKASAINGKRQKQNKKQSNAKHQQHAKSVGNQEQHQQSTTTAASFSTHSNSYGTDPIIVAANGSTATGSYNENGLLTGSCTSHKTTALTPIVASNHLEPPSQPLPPPPPPDPSGTAPVTQTQAPKPATAPSNSAATTIPVRSPPPGFTAPAVPNPTIPAMSPSAATETATTEMSSLSLRQQQRNDQSILV